MKFLLVIAAFFSAHAFANNSELTVEMNTTSKAYLCNAGIKHAVAPASQSCRIQDTAQVCTPGEANCLCTGITGNQYLSDFFSYSSTPFGSTNASPTISLNAGLNNFVTAAKDAVSFEQSLNGLTFKPSSEYFGATFFFDVCVRGPEVKYFEETGLTREGSFLLRSNIHRLSEDKDGIPNITNDDEYADVSKLNVRAVIHCDLQGLGANRHVVDSSGAFNPRNSDIDWAALASGQKGTSDFSFLSESILYEAGNNSLPATMLITSTATNRGQIPRFCVVRYEFSETALLNRNLAKFKNKLVLNFDAYAF